MPFDININFQEDSLIQLYWTQVVLIWVDTDCTVNSTFIHFFVLYRSFYCMAAVVAKILMSERIQVEAMPSDTTD